MLTGKTLLVVSSIETTGNSILAYRYAGYMGPALKAGVKMKKGGLLMAWLWKS